MWTDRQSGRLKEERNVGSWLLHRSPQTLWKSISATEGKGWESCLPWRREWTIIRLKTRGDFEHYKKGCYCGMTELPWCVLWAKIPFHFHHTQTWNYSSRKSYKLCSPWSIWTSQIISHSTWRSVPEIDWQCFNYLGCGWRQNKSLRGSQKAWKVLSKLCYQLETTRMWPKLIIRVEISLGFVRAIR